MTDILVNIRVNFTLFQNTTIVVLRKCFGVINEGQIGKAY